MKRIFVVLITMLMLASLSYAAYEPKGININTPNSGNAKYSTGNFRNSFQQVRSMDATQIKDFISQIKSNKGNFDFNSYKDMFSGYRSQYASGNMDLADMGPGNTQRNRQRDTDRDIDRNTVREKATREKTAESSNGRASTAARGIKFDEYIKSDLIKYDKQGMLDDIKEAEGNGWSTIRSFKAKDLYQKRDFNTEGIKNIDDKIAISKADFEERRKFLDDKKKQIKEEIMAGNKEEALRLMKEAVGDVSAKINDFLEKKKSEIMENPHISEGEAQQLTSLLDSVMEKIPTYLSEIENAQSLDDVRKTVREMRMEWADVRNRNRDIDYFTRGRDLNKFNIKATQLAANIKSLLDEKGIDLSDSQQAQFDEAMEHIANAKAMQENIEALKDDLLAGDDDARKKAEEFFRNGKSEAEQARNILEELYDGLKDEIGNIEILDDEEIPVIVPPPSNDLPPMPPPVSTMPVDMPEPTPVGGN